VRPVMLRVTTSGRSQVSLNTLTSHSCANPQPRRLKPSGRFAGDPHLGLSPTTNSGA
jgi:hypothetical protein